MSRKLKEVETRKEAVRENKEWNNGRPQTQYKFAMRSETSSLHCGHGKTRWTRPGKPLFFCLLSPRRIK